MRHEAPYFNVGTFTELCPNECGALLLPGELAKLHIKKDDGKWTPGRVSKCCSDGKLNTEEMRERRDRLQHPPDIFKVGTPRPSSATPSFCFNHSSPSDPLRSLLKRPRLQSGHQALRQAQLPLCSGIDSSDEEASAPLRCPASACEWWGFYARRHFVRAAGLTRIFPLGEYGVDLSDLYPKKVSRRPDAAMDPTQFGGDAQPIEARQEDGEEGAQNDDGIPMEHSTGGSPYWMAF